MPLVNWIPQLVKDVSRYFYKRAKKVVREKVNDIRQDVTSEGHNKASTASQPEIILRDEEGGSLTERLAEEIIENGIECKAVPDLGSVAIKERPYYSYFFAMSPRITTNRGYIRIGINSGRNIDLIQTIQKN
jgi:hypothetical protein